MTGAIRSMGGGNAFFRDIGFPGNEVQALLLQGDLAIQIRKAIDTLGLTQADAAKRARVTLPRMNDLVNKPESHIHAGCIGDHCSATLVCGEIVTAEDWLTQRNNLKNNSAIVMYFRPTVCRHKTAAYVR